MPTISIVKTYSTCLRMEAALAELALEDVGQDAEEDKEFLIEKGRIYIHSYSKFQPNT